MGMELSGREMNIIIWDLRDRERGKFNRILLLVSLGGKGPSIGSGTVLYFIEESTARASLQLLSVDI